VITGLLRRVGPRPVLLSRYVAFRVRERARQRLLRRAYPRLVVRAPTGARLRIEAIDLPEARELPADLREGAERLRAEAELILDGTVSFLGSGPVQVGPEIDWHRDFKSGYRWNSTTFYQDLEVTRLTDSSDAKVPWELSRGHQLLTLARAAALFRDERYAGELERQLSDWIDANPPGFGINWVNPMEVAIRAVNWIWALRTVEARHPVTDDLRRRVTASLQVHGRHIALNLEGSPLLRSNHYLSDVLGLLALGTLIEDDPAARRWSKVAHRELERQIVDQVYDDGAGFEGSTSYHGLALEIFLVAWMLGVESGQPFSSNYRLRLERMLDASAAIRHPQGRSPLFGDGDSGRILPGGFERPPTHDPLLWIGAALLQRERPFDGPVDAEVAWTLGVGAWQRAHVLAPPRRPPAAYPRGGVYVLRGGGCHAVVRCGDVGQNGAGGHAHNDPLSYELSYGSPLVVDSGTYVYTSDPVARNAFRSSRAHNVVVVDGIDVNPIPTDDMFRLPQFAHVTVDDWSEAEAATRLVARHDGYRRVGDGVVHRRTFHLDHRSGRLSVQDELSGTGTPALASYVHLAPGTMATRTSSGEFVLSAGDARARVVFRGFDDVELEEGWVSSEFGVRERAPLIVGRRVGNLPVSFGYTFGAVPSVGDTNEVRELAGTLDA
jgi:uncharacterized heparinase superfamily protein